MSDDDKDDPSRYGPMLGLLALTGASSLAVAMLDVFEVAKLSAEDRRYLRGPVTQHESAWNVDMPRWIVDQAKAERFEVVLGSLPGHLVGPSELLACMYGAMHDAVRSHDLTQLYLWCGAHACARHYNRTVDEHWKMLGMTAVTDAEVLDRGGRLHHVYRDLAYEIRRSVARHAPKGAGTPTQPPSREPPIDYTAIGSISEPLAARMANQVRPEDHVLVGETGGAELIHAVEARHPAGIEVLPQSRLLDRMAEPTFDAVLWNPPLTGEADIAHALKAWELIRPGGYLAVILREAAFHPGSHQERLQFGAWRRQTNASGIKLAVGSLIQPDPVKLRLLTARRGANA